MTPAPPVFVVPKQAPHTLCSCGAAVVVLLDGNRQWVLADLALALVDASGRQLAPRHQCDRQGVNVGRLGKR